MGKKEKLLHLKNMPRNAEIKARVDDLEAIKARAKELSGTDGTEIAQSDTFFKVSNGRLKLRHLKGDPAQLIFYSRSDQEGPKLSDYNLAESHVPEDLSKVLDMAIGIRGKVQTFALYIFQDCGIHKLII